MPRPILTLTQVARRLGVSTRTIRVYEEEGFITIERSGGRCLIDSDQIEDIVLVQRLRRQLGVNHSGVGVILEMRRRMIDLRDRLDEMQGEFERRLEEALFEQKNRLQGPLARVEPRDPTPVRFDED
ncbi:MAG: MerR family transcriptional regulator [Pseudomonadota bacterium]